jgi:DNA transformation protein
MPVTPGFRTFALEQLARVAIDLRSKSMFGGVGVYSGEFFFALLDDDTLFLKVDDATRPGFEKRGYIPWAPGGGPASTGYYELSAEVLEDVDELRPWIEGAIAVAMRKKKAGRKQRRTP